MPKATLQSGLKLHYQRTGRGPDLVMIHGLTGNLAVWHLKIVPMLADHFRILTYDLRGHGYSDMPPSGYTATDMAADLEGLLDDLGIEQANLVGHSYGADIALYYAFRNPSRVLQVGAVEAALPALIHLRTREDWVGWTYWVEVLERSGVTVPPEHRCDLEYMVRLSMSLPKKWGPLRGLPRNPEKFLRVLDSTPLTSDYEVVGDLTLENIPRVEAPVHLIYAEGSAFLGSHDYLLEHLPNARSVMLPSSEWGHFGPLEQPEAVVGHLIESLAPPSAAEDGRVAIPRPAQLRA
ncbi:alpha/beta fold hydrolase [Paludisphaera borealis]|uniref:2-(Acetamidomethylene)succinate hydrolase n=1 Tax=Paludisphaera borealis TaxID=1387353 RepID=A0A1U7CTU6_9BACT|nr:alpha/beta hydrolase [Paludisphaera borealis]APW62351.1 2-(acetamidomethylene)succinate hydrolase [Paludisphaera borealis]